MEENKKKVSLAVKFGLGFALLCALFLTVYLITVITGSSAFFRESGEKNAQIYFEEDIARAEQLAETHYTNLYEIVDKVKFAKTREAVETIVESYIGSELFGDLRYFSQGVCYAANGIVVTEDTGAAEYIAALSEANNRGCTPVYYDTYTELDCIAFFVPVRGSAFIDGILSVVPARNLVSVGSVINDKASLVTIISPDGKVLSETRAEGYTEDVGNNFYDFVDLITENRTYSANLAEAIASEKKTSVTIETAKKDYTLAISPLTSFDSHVYLVSMSEIDGLVDPELAYVRHVTNIMFFAIIGVILCALYVAFNKGKTKRALAAAILVDSKLDCPNAEQFKLTAKDRIAVYRRKYAIGVLSIRNFVYLNEEFGQDNATDILKEIVKIIQSITTKKEECFGYAGDGKFLLLMINANSHSISDRIKLIENIINRNDLLIAKGTKLRFSVGVYNVISAYRKTVQEMIDCAATASTYSEDDPKAVYTTYSEEIKEEIARNEKIETMMESALAAREFRLFLQPKYDAQHDCVHSAEALVRWFDTESGEYKYPQEFIPLFETNGFIVKLDHYIYIEVLEYLSGAAKRGEKVVPVAVNVSRVTATNPDFINFYVGNKKRYGIPDNFLTLELTESFAMEDYDKISAIITALHNGGLRCSIDDFGSGFSSFSILKQITVDEVKLDSVFIKRGIDIRRDDKLHSAMIDLTKSMGMSVVQEGVETKEVFDKVISMGCNIIQGFYYAKAMPVEEFRIFITTNTSIKYKALVK